VKFNKLEYCSLREGGPTCGHVPRFGDLCKVKNNIFENFKLNIAIGMCATRMLTLVGQVVAQSTPPYTMPPGQHSGSLPLLKESKK
jgi:hypothetical protein